MYIEKNELILMLSITLKVYISIFLRNAPDVNAPPWTPRYGASTAWTPGIQSAQGTTTPWHAPTPTHGHATKRPIWSSDG